MLLGLCSYSVEQATGLAELQAVSCQFRLQAALFTQQVRHQNTDQVGAAGAGQHLDLHAQTNWLLKCHHQVFPQADVFLQQTKTYDFRTI